jgi:hypothetical protein
MKRYFKHVGDSELGTGEVWFEFEGEIATRQIEQYGDRWFSSRDEYHGEIGPSLTDQPLSELDLEPEHEISAEEFERVWQESGA